MNRKLYSLLLMVTAVCVIHVAGYSQQCAIARTGQNLCNSAQTSYLSNTSNTITIYDAGLTPVAGTYNVTISYYDQGTNACASLITCSGTVSASGSTTTISLSGCSTLPDLSATGIVYIDLQSASGSYFFHIYGGACMLPLPIDLTAFSVQRDGNTVKVMWTTAQESNASGVYIERNSVAGSGVFDWDIGFVPATNTSTSHSYTFIDQYPLNGTSSYTNYYRLRMVDLDGKFTRSTYVATSCNGCNVTPPLINCASYNVSGPSVLCSGTANYSISTLIYYNTYTWMLSSSAAGYDNIHGPSTNLTQYGNGVTTLTLSLSRCTSNTNTKTKDIDVGKAVGGYYNDPSGQQVTLIEDGSGTNYGSSGYYSVHITKPYNYQPTWSYLAGNITSWQWSPGQDLNFYMQPGGSAMFQLDINTDCGPATYYYDFIENSSYSVYMVSPNPASSQLNVYVDDRKLNKMDAKQVSGQSIQQVIVTDKMGNAVMTQKYAADTRNVSLNIAALRPDVYTIRIFNGKKWETRKFIKR